MIIDIRRGNVGSRPELYVNDKHAPRTDTHAPHSITERHVRSCDVQTCRPQRKEDETTHEESPSVRSSAVTVATLSLDEPT